MTEYSGDPVNVLPMPSPTALTVDQARRVTCLALVLALVRGRSVHINTVWELAAWCAGEPKP